MNSSSSSILFKSASFKEKTTPFNNNMIRSTLVKQLPTSSTIKQSHYFDHITSHKTIRKRLHFSNKKFESKPLSKSILKINEKNGVENIILKEKMKKHNPQQLYDSPMKMQTNPLQRVDKQKKIKIHQTSLQRLIKVKLDSSKLQLWSSPFLRQTFSQQKFINNTSINKIITKRRLQNSSNTSSVPINYLIHQFNKLFKYQKQKNFTAAGLSDQTVMNKCNYFKTTIRDSKYLSTKILSGIRQNTPLDARAYIKFYGLFIGNSCNKQQKIKFIEYFFIPQQLQQIQTQYFKLLIELLCQKSIFQSNPQPSSNAQNQSMPDLLCQIILKQFQQQHISRKILRQQLLSVQQLVDLLIELMKK